MLQQPVETHCGHLFCDACLRKDQTVCPTCRSTLVGKSPPATAAFQRLLAGLKVRCPHGQPPPKKRSKAVPSAALCDWTGSYADLWHHLNKCAFEPVACPRGCGEESLRRKDLEAHLSEFCTAGAPCDVCGEKVPFCAAAAHEASAALQHVALLKRRCDALQRAQDSFAAAQSQCVGQWLLPGGSELGVRKGACLRTKWVRLGQAVWHFGVVAQVRFFPCGTQTSAEGRSALKVVFDEAQLSVEVVVAVTAGVRTVRGIDTRLDLSKANETKYVKTTFNNFMALSPDELAKELRIDVDIRGVVVSLHTDKGR